MSVLRTAVSTGTLSREGRQGMRASSFKRSDSTRSGVFARQRRGRRVSPVDVSLLRSVRPSAVIAQPLPARGSSSAGAIATVDGVLRVLAAAVVLSMLVTALHDA